MRVVILLRVVQVDHGIFSDFSNSQVSPSMFVDPDPKVSTKVQRLSFEYFTSRGCLANRGEEVNWVATILNSLSLYPICCLGPC